RPRGPISSSMTTGTRRRSTSPAASPAAWTGASRPVSDAVHFVARIRPGSATLGRMSAASLHALPAAAGPTLVAREATFEELYEEHFDFVWRNARRLGVGEAAVDDA